MSDLIVVAAHGPDFADQCVASLPANVEHIVIDTGSGTVPNADVQLDGGHPTAAYRWAYEHTDADGFLFLQDSCAAVEPDPLAWFRRWMPRRGGAVAWGLFDMAFDTPGQMTWVLQQYPDVPIPKVGIMGPIFYTTRASLDILASRNLLPAIPADRMQAQGTERAWAFAFDGAGLPVIGPMWDQPAMRVAFGPLRKTWAARP